MSGGYKQSQLGNIPKDWLISTIEKEANICTGGKDTQDKVDDGLYPFFVRSNTIERINSYSFDGEAVLTSGDGVGVGKIYHYLDCKFDYHQRVYNIHNFSKNLNGKFFYYFFSNHFYQRVMRLSAKNSVDSVRRNMISEMEIPLPPLPEQQKIAEILSTVDTKIEVIDQQISKTQELKKGLMQRLLTKGIGHTEFKDSPLGEIPKGWEVANLGDISEVKGRIGYRGYTKADLVEKGEGALAIGGAQISKENRLNLTKPVYLNWEKYEESPEIKVNVGNIVFAQRGTLGRTALIESLPERATINPSMVLIKNITCNNKLLFYYLCSSHVQNIVSSISTSTAVPMISQKQIKAFKIGLPPMNEQERIAEILSSVDDKSVLLNEKKKTYKKLKQGLMQQLLTGKVRVKINNSVSA